MQLHITGNAILIVYTQKLPLVIWDLCTHTFDHTVYGPAKRNISHVET